MTKETFTVPAFEVTLERTEDEDTVLLNGVEFSIRETYAHDWTHPALKNFSASVRSYLDANKPDPKPGFTVRHEVDGEWKWTAVFSPSPEDVSNIEWPWNVTDNAGVADWFSRKEFAALCERDGVTL